MPAEAGGRGEGRVTQTNHGGASVASVEKSPNFGFLLVHGPLYHGLASVAERVFFVDPGLTLVKLRQLSEAFARHAAARAGLLSDRSDSSFAQVDLLRVLEQRGIVKDQIADLFHALRKLGNRAVHDFTGTRQEAVEALRLAYRLACWFHRTFGDVNVRLTFKPPPYVPPPDPTVSLRAIEDEAARAKAESEKHRADADAAKRALELAEASRVEEEALRKKAEAERAEWESFAQTLESEQKKNEAEHATEIAALKAEAAKNPAVEEKFVVAQSTVATIQTELDEEETRIIIDAQLRAAGWEVDSRKLRHAWGTRPEKGKSRAIAEWPTESGPADYVLFVGLTPLAIVEAKKTTKKIPTVLDQARRYSRTVRIDAPLVPPAPKGEDPTLFAGWVTSSEGNERYRVPFMYATNGRTYLRQSHADSGVWFLDGRKPSTHPRVLTGWHAPQTLVEMLAHDPDEAHVKLDADPMEYIDRDYQRRAIRAAEGAIASGKREALIAMATGTGKTRMAIGLIHRLLKSERFRRVLFLVDRSALGEQAHNAFKEMRLENLQTFAQNYDVMGLEDTAPASETKVHIATVQGMVKRVLWSSPDDPPVLIDRYDCIIVDESHRGYTLDREVSEGELELRDLGEYVSTYRRVLDHFDAVKIGLTATPALHTREIFGDPVFVYAYPEAVADGFLVDHEPPVRIVTKLAKHGIHFDKGTEAHFTRPDGVQLALLPDEMDFDIESFNKSVITDNFNRAVCEELAKAIDPYGDEKTIVFCVDDDHAERFVPILKEALGKVWGAIDDETVRKITGKIDRPLDAIRRFKNEKLPNVAVTVDLLTTGIDVPRVANLVFLRRVRSRILFEQMMGRATRLCPEIGKEVFRIYDAVDLYAALEDVTEMKPLVRDATRTTRQLVEELLDPRALKAKGLEDGRSHADDVFREIVEKLRRTTRRIEKRDKTPILQSTIDSLEALFGCPLTDIAEELHDMGTPKAIGFFQAKAEALVLIENLSLAAYKGKDAIISDHPDEVLAVERGYGTAKKPEDYLAAFAKFIDENKNTIPALTVVCTRPKDLTRAQLKELKLKLDAAGYSEATVRAAWREWKNQDIAATIIGFIRQRALGAPLVPYEERVDKALAKTLASSEWTSPQRKWLERIGEQMKREVVVDEEAFSRGAFVNVGGWKGVDKVLGGRLRSVLDAIGDNVWNDREAA
jgi:type I restriction enzyme R subunit